MALGELSSKSDNSESIVYNPSISHTNERIFQKNGNL